MIEPECYLCTEAPHPPKHLQADNDSSLRFGKVESLIFCEFVKAEANGQTSLQMGGQTDRRMPQSAQLHYLHALLSYSVNKTDISLTIVAECTKGSD